MIRNNTFKIAARDFIHEELELDKQLKEEDII
jgi:hypothetical protein